MLFNTSQGAKSNNIDWTLDNVLASSMGPAVVSGGVAVRIWGKIAIVQIHDIKFSSIPTADGVIAAGLPEAAYNTHGELSLAGDSGAAQAIRVTMIGTELRVDYNYTVVTGKSYSGQVIYFIK